MEKKNIGLKILGKWIIGPMIIKIKNKQAIKKDNVNIKINIQSVDKVWI